MNNHASSSLRLSGRDHPAPGTRTSGVTPAAGRRLRKQHQCCGFTLVELLSVLLILSLLGVLSYRGLASVLDARAHVSGEAAKWQRVAAFFSRFEHDVQLAAPRPVRAGSDPGAGELPAWRAQPEQTPGPRLEFSRFASSEAAGHSQRIAYRLNERQEIELWLWPGLDPGPGTLPARHPVLTGVNRLELRYLAPTLMWVVSWPVSGIASPLPRAVQLRIVLTSGEDIVRVISL